MYVFIKLILTKRESRHKDTRSLETVVKTDDVRINLNKEGVEA
jgi:hypothetical protein